MEKGHLISLLSTLTQILHAAALFVEYFEEPCVYADGFGAPRYKWIKERLSVMRPLIYYPLSNIHYSIHADVFR